MNKSTAEIKDPIKLNLPKDAFSKLKSTSNQGNLIVRESISFRKDVWRRIRKDKLAMIGLSFVIFITLVAIFAPFLTPYDYATTNLMITNQSPSSVHIFGTDHLGRDILTRIVYGARISMTVAYASTIVALVIGVLYGGIAGFVGGKVDLIMMRIVEILLGIPSLLYLIFIMVMFENIGVGSVILAMSITGWLSMARMVRTHILGQKQHDYVMAVRTLGIGEGKILFKHLLPNSLGIIIINLTFSIPSAIFQEAFLSYLGLGVSAPTPSWGISANEALLTYTKHPFQLLFPALAICLTILAFNFLGDGLRDALDPKMRK